MCCLQNKHCQITLFQKYFAFKLVSWNHYCSRYERNDQFLEWKELNKDDCFFIIAMLITGGDGKLRATKWNNHCPYVDCALHSDLENAIAFGFWMSIGMTVYTLHSLHYGIKTIQLIIKKYEKVNIIPLKYHLVKNSRFPNQPFSLTVSLMIQLEEIL